MSGRQPSGSGGCREGNFCDDPGREDKAWGGAVARERDREDGTQVSLRRKINRI